MPRRQQQNGQNSLERVKTQGGPEADADAGCRLVQHEMRFCSGVVFVLVSVPRAAFRWKGLVEPNRSKSS